jgi:hypothetical protein
MVTAASALEETLQPTVFLSMLSELGSAIETYSAAKTSEDASTTAANNAMLAVRKMIVSCQSFKKPEDFLNFLRHCEQSLNISTTPFQAQTPFNGAVCDTREYLILLNQWLDHHNLGSLDHWASQINRSGKTDPETAERMGNIRTLLSQCHYSNSPDIQLTAENNKKAPHVRAAFDSRYALKEEWYHNHIASGGTKKDSDNLEKVAKLSAEFVQQFVHALDPNTKNGLVNILAGPHQDAQANSSSKIKGIALPEQSLLHQTQQLETYNPELKGPFRTQRTIKFWPFNISSSAIGLFFQKIIRGSAFLVNSGFGLFPNVNILDAIASTGRQQDPHYQSVKKLQHNGEVAADSLHRFMDLAGVITANLEGCGLEEHLAAARMVADAIESAQIQGLTINKESFLDRVRGSFAQPSYPSYFLLHLLNSTRYEGLRATTEQLLSQTVSEGLQEERDLIMGIDEKTGDRKAPSLFNFLNLLKAASAANVANVSGKLGNFASLMNTPDLESQSKLLSKTFFQNSAISPLFHIIHKLGLTVEQLEHPKRTNEFAAKRVASPLRRFWLNWVTPAVIVTCDPIVSLWEATKQVPVVNLITGLPARIIEGLHGAVGSILGVIPFAGKPLKSTWELLTPGGLLAKTLHYKGTYHAHNAGQYCLDTITTPFVDLRSQLKQITENVSSPSSLHLFVSAAQNLRNFEYYLPGFIMEQAKAERCGVGMHEQVFRRLGIPLNGQSASIETFVKTYRDMVRSAYNDLYGAEANATHSFTPPTVMDNNPYGNKNFSFGFQYVNTSGETVTEFSNEYFDPEINDPINGHMIYGDEAKERNRADFERLQRDTEKAQAEFKATLSRIMKTGILSHVDSLAPVMKGLQRTTSNLVQGDLKQPIDLYGATSMTRPTPRATSLNPGNSIRKYKRATLKIGGITHEIMTPQAPPADSVFDPRVAVLSR